MQDDSDKPNYNVGYGRPPRKTQYTKGQSGNPKGRPRGSKSWKTLLEEELREMVTVYVNGKPKRISKKRLVVKRAVHRAAAEDDLKGLETLGAFQEPALLLEEAPVYPPTFTLKLEEDRPEKEV